MSDNTSDDSNVILETIDVKRYFGGLKAVDGVSIQVERGSLHSIIGPNGAGKTTFFNVVSSELPATSGRVLFKGHDITEVPRHRIAHLGIGRSFQITNVFPHLSVLENVRLAAQALGSDNFKLWRHFAGFHDYLDRAEAVVEMVDLAERRFDLATTLSHGDKRKLELAMILAPDPELLLLDEPTAGMASEQVPELMETIESIRTTGDKTIMLVEHNMNVVMQASDRITVMARGKVLAEGTPAEIRQNEDVQRAYLGQLYE